MCDPRAHDLGKNLRIYDKMETVHFRRHKLTGVIGPQAHTAGSHLSEHAGTKGHLNNWISKILFVYKAEHFPFNAQQKHEYHYISLDM